MLTRHALKTKAESAASLLEILLFFASLSVVDRLVNYDVQDMSYRSLPKISQLFWYIVYVGLFPRFHENPHRQTAA